jgi:hypothetical protein
VTWILVTDIISTAGKELNVALDRDYIYDIGYVRHEFEIYMCVYGTKIDNDDDDSKCFGEVKDIKYY